VKTFHPQFTFSCNFEKLFALGGAAMLFIRRKK
jgi:hypothetical protein